VITICRHINGISINPLEFLIDNEGDLIKFHNIDEAHKFMRDKGFDENEITESYSYFDEDIGELI